MTVRCVQLERNKKFAIFFEIGFPFRVLSAVYRLYGGVKRGQKPIGVLGKLRWAEKTMKR